MCARPARPLSGRYYGYLGWSGTMMPAPAPRVEVSSARFTDGAWVTLDSRSVGPTETRIADVKPGGTLSNYVSSTGDLRVRVRCTTTAGSFYASANQLRVAYDRPAS